MKNLFLVMALLSVAACSKMRNLAGQQEEGQVLPPVTKPSNVAYTLKDERPVVKTPDGFVPSQILGVTNPPPPQGEVITYIGPSN